MRDKIIGFIISVVCFIISFGFVKGQAMALPFVPTDWTWEMYQGLHMLGDLLANDVNFEVPDWVDFNDFDDVKLFLENIYNEGKKKVAYASIIADLCVGTWENFLVTGEVDLGFSEQNIKRVHNTGFFQHIVDTITSESINPNPDVGYLSYLEQINGNNGNGTDFFWQDLSGIPLMYHIEYTISANYGDMTYFVSNSYDPIIASANNTNTMFYMPRQDLHINSIGDSQYSVSETYSYTTNIQLPPLWGNPSYSRSFKIQNGNLLNGSVGSTIENNTYTYSDSGTLQEIFSNLARKCRGINIYVDGLPWSILGEPSIDNPLGVVIPDNTIDDIQVGDTKGHVISATLPDTDNLVGSIDLGVVVDELREAQAEGRQASLEKVKTKEGVKAIDGTVVDTKTKAVAIDVPVVSSVVASADDFGYIPYYPEIPSAFSGTTILSELIDATQNIIPNELIMAIWGLVIILFIIALIKIFYR